MSIVEALKPEVVDVAIVGAGLCGLALARSVRGQGLSVLLVEARERLGGRVPTQRCEATGQALDMGPTWFWPQTEPRMAALLAELGLASVAQHDPGDALWLTDPNREPERRAEQDGVHAGARRIEGGAARLVQALAADLPVGTVATGSALRLVRDRGAWLELQLEQQDGRRRLVRARQAALALPPRLVAEHIAFDPPLPAALAEALAATPTWMAAQAKAITTFEQPFWRAAGHSGNAFVRHAQAVLGEVFDASDPTGQAGALGGFVALGPELRQAFRRGMPMLLESQLAQLYGAQAQQGHQHLLDWADEPWTCAPADRQQASEPPQADPRLRQPCWAGRLFFGGSESAAHGAGHMEGALEAAARIARAVRRPAAAGPGTAAPGTLAHFQSVVMAQRTDAPSWYRQHLARLLSGQQSEQLTQRALLATADQVYSQTLKALDGLGLPADAAPESGRHRLTPALLAAFKGWNSALLADALAFNADSCALSNFPQEHRPDAALQRAIALDLAAAWREFALELNARLMAASTPEVLA